MVWKKNFSGIPNSRSVLFLQIFLNLGFRELDGRKSCSTWPGSAPKPSRPSPEPSPEPCCAWPSLAFSGTQLNLTWLRPSPEPSPEPCWTWPGSAPKPPGTFSRTLLNLTWLCTKASHTFSETFSGTLLNLTWLCTKSPRPSPEPCWTWPGSAPKPPRNLLQNSVEPNLALHQSLPHLLRNLLRNPVELDLALHQVSQTFSGTLLNLTWLCTKASPEPSPELCWT